VSRRPNRWTIPAPLSHESTPIWVGLAVIARPPGPPRPSRAYSTSVGMLVPHAANASALVRVDCRSPRPRPGRSRAHDRALARRLGSALRRPLRRRGASRRSPATTRRRPRNGRSSAAGLIQRCHCAAISPRRRGFGYFGLRQNISFSSHFFIIGAPRFELGTSSPPD
jgi:hypothetical protein